MFIINRIDNKNYLLDGHRRREAISQLIKEDAVCFNEKAKSWVKASLLYSKMNVQFHENLHTADAFSKAHLTTFVGSIILELLYLSSTFNLHIGIVLSVTSIVSFS